MDAIDNLSPDRPLLYDGMIIELHPARFSRECDSIGNLFVVRDDDTGYLGEHTFCQTLTELGEKRRRAMLLDGGCCDEAITVAPLEHPDSGFLLSLGMTNGLEPWLLTGADAGSIFAAVGYMDDGVPVITHEAEWNQDGTLSALKAKTPSTGALFPRVAAQGHNQALCLV